MKEVVQTKKVNLPKDYDIIIVGSGAGGGTAAYALAKAGKRVLIVERGRKLNDSEILQDEEQMIIRRVAHDNRELIINGRAERLFIGGVVGGGTFLYGGALLRPSPEDFHPGLYYEHYLPRQLWDWPINYEHLSPYYEQAEDLYQVSGDNSQVIPHLAKRKHSYNGKMPQLQPINEILYQRLKAKGLSPFHLPLAIDFTQCLLCPRCPGYGCPNESRASSLNCCIKPAIDQYGAHLWTETEAVKLNTDSHRTVESITVRHVRTGQRREIRAETYLISAGAIGTPVLLMHSGIGDSSSDLGRNFMYHAGAIVVCIFIQPTGGSERFIKQLGWTNDYFGTSDFPHKLGYVQMLPIPGPLSLKKESPIPLPLPLARFLYKRAVTFTGCVEDLPQAENRIELKANGRIWLHHRFHEYDIFRSKYYLRRLKNLLRKCGASVVIGATSERDDIHTAHQVGTCRFGNDSKTSVLDPMCRLHEIDNVFVVDGSFMPTSLGVGPALTIIANALRVSDYIIKEGL